MENLEENNLELYSLLFSVTPVNPEKCLQHKLTCELNKTKKLDRRPLLLHTNTTQGRAIDHKSLGVTLQFWFKKSIVELLFEKMTNK